MTFLLILALGAIVGIALLVAAARHFRRPRQLFQSAFATAKTTGLASFPLWLALLVWRLIVDPSSTAAVAIYGVPLLAALLSGVVFAVTWALVTLGGLAKSGSRNRRALAKGFLALSILAGLAAWLIPAVRQEILIRQAESSATPSARLAELFNSEAVQQDAAIVAAIAANPQTPPEVLASIAASPRPEWKEPRVSRLRRLLLAPGQRPSTVASAIAGNPSLPPDALAGLPTERADAAWELAQNPRTPPERLSVLAERSEASVRSAVAYNRSTPAGTLARLGRDPERQVRLIVAGNPNTPSATLETLARDPWADIRVHVAMNPKTPRPTLEALAKDSDERVRRYAAPRLDASPNRSQ